MPTETEQVVDQLISDYEFWAENCFYIRDKRNELIPLKLNYVQREIGRIEKEELEKHGNARIYVLKARQPGVSTDQQARSLHTIWSTPGATALTLAHNIDDTDKLFEVTRRAIQNFPEELMPETGRSEAKEVTFPGLDSKFWTGTAGATRLGRGITITRFHGSEFAFWNQPRSVLNRITPAMIPIGSTIVLETTPDKFDSEAHRFWQESVKGETGYLAVFFPWWVCDPVFYRYPLNHPDELGELQEEEQILVNVHGLTLEQIKWRRKKIKEMGVSEFMREYPEDPELCWTTAGEKFYQVEQLQILIKKVPTVLNTDFGGKIKIYGDRALKTKHGIIYEDVIIGSDVAEGSSSGLLDRTTWAARAYPSWRLLSEFESTKIEPIPYAALLARWANDIYAEALLVVEKNFHGITVLRELRDRHKYPKRSIYHRTALIQDVDSKTDYMGWTTTGETLPLMLDYGSEIIQAAVDGFIYPPSKAFVLDALGVSEGKLNSRDMLVAEILAWIGRMYLVKRKIIPGTPLHY